MFDINTAHLLYAQPYVETAAIEHPDCRLPVEWRLFRDFTCHTRPLTRPSGQRQTVHKDVIHNGFVWKSVGSHTGQTCRLGLHKDERNAFMNRGQQ
jgi:hypothetical protein